VAYGVAVACYYLGLGSVLSQQTVLDPTQVKYALGPTLVLMHPGTHVLGPTF